MNEEKAVLSSYNATFLYGKPYQQNINKMLWSVENSD